MATRCIHVRVDGRVQGVGYRAFVLENADELGLAGWIRNRRDGSVEAVFQGGEAAIEEMLRLCSAGPPASRVTSVEQIGEGVATFSGFEVQPTA
jgi:acylphosphatase